MANPHAIKKANKEYFNVNIFVNTKVLLLKK